VAKKPYVAPAIDTVGALSDLTLSNKYSTTHPDGVLYHPPTGPAVPLTS
jgi:hypothetical protein